MGLRSSLRTLSNLQQQTTVVKGSRKAIFDIRDNLRGTQLFSDIFYHIVTNPERPPVTIIANYSDSSFWSKAWVAAENNYEPYSTVKYQDVNIGYYESCAIFLLIQECFPNVYDFPNKTVTQIQNGEPIELIMKNNFAGRRLIAASLPPQPTAESAPTAATGPSPDTVFCSHCGAKHQKGTNFCSSCGNKL